ncbi:MAG: glycosyltransferase family 9 protein [Verrucomicrobiae bacterium]|nr:glycosyltransferase family 9 protein [Verrucomicrobiae bacterium]
MKKLLAAVYSALFSSGVTRAFFEAFFHLMGRRGEMDLCRARRILVVRLDEIGDVALTVPFLRRLRSQCADARITLVVNSKTRNLVENCPYVDGVLAFDPPQTGGLFKARRLGRAIGFASLKLWRLNCDAAFVPRRGTDVYYGAKCLAFLSGARHRLALRWDCLKAGEELDAEGGSWMTQMFEAPIECHEAEAPMALFAPWTKDGKCPEAEGLELWPSPDDDRTVRSLLSSGGFSPEKGWIALGVGAARAFRRWPEENFIEIARFLTSERHGVVVVGGPMESALGDRLVREVGKGALNAAGRTTLSQLAALMCHCRLYAGNDSGPMHIAAAMGIPVVEISSHARSANPFHACSPSRFGPWRTPHRALRPDGLLPPCRNACAEGEPHCIRQIGLAEVRTAIAELTGERV